MEKIIIAAVAKNNVIGNKGQIPWHSKAELQHFKKTTLGHPIIMGRITYESIGKPLPGRLNIVISSNDKLDLPDGVLRFSNLTEAYNYCKAEEKVFIIGGGRIYKEAINNVDKLIITVMNLEVEGDTFFPKISDSIWIVSDETKSEEFSIITYIKK